MNQQRKDAVVILYKYFPPIRTRDVFDSLHLRVSQTRALNDPFELNPVITGIGDIESMKNQYRTELLDRANLLWDNEPGTHQRFSTKDALIHTLVTQNPILAMSAQEFEELYIPTLQDSILEQDSRLGIISLSERRDSVLMWAHYTCGFTGFCVGFDARGELLRWNGDTEPTNHAEMLNRVWKVQYSTRRPRNAWDSLNIFDFYLTKNSDWSYEQEWRIIKPFSHCTSPNQHNSVDNFKLPIWVCSFSPEDVREVYIGPAMVDENNDAILAAATDKFKHAHFQIVKLDPKQYGLIFDDDS